MTLDELLDTVHVDPPDFIPDQAPKGWWAVATEDKGVIAYFPTQHEALRYRLDYINRQLNPER